MITRRVFGSRSGGGSISDIKRRESKIINQAAGVTHSRARRVGDIAPPRLADIDIISYRA